MIEVVFISDLHLHPDDSQILDRFNHFITWARTKVKTIYILGDFFHAWSGDDSINEWSQGIAQQLKALTEEGISIFYMHGNRDFLLGEQFAACAGWTVLTEPSLIYLGEQQILLAHGDRYCTKDRSHQRFRKLTRTPLFSKLFLKLPLSLRNRLVHKVRTISQNGPSKTKEALDVVMDSVNKELSFYKVNTLIHGHTHKPGLVEYTRQGEQIQRYILSDWDDSPQLLCYDSTKGLYFARYDEGV